MAGSPGPRCRAAAAGAESDRLTGTGYARQAVAGPWRAKQAGIRRDPRKNTPFDRRADFASLREWPDFKALLAGLTGASS